MLARSLTIAMVSCSGLWLSPRIALAQPAPAFTLDFDGPSTAGAFPRTSVTAGIKCRLQGTSLPGAPGAQAWSLGVEAAGSCRIVLGTTLATAGASVREGGFRRDDGFEHTELTSGAGNEGVVSVVVLSRTGGATLDPPGSPHHVLGLEVEGKVPEGCTDCALRYRSGLEGSLGPVKLTVTQAGQTVEPATRAATLGLCGVPCFAPQPVPGFNELEVDDAVVGSARSQKEVIEVCSSSRGYGGPQDALLTLVQETGVELEASAEVLSVDGQAGVEARAFTGTGSDPQAPAIRIAVEASAAAGFVLRSAVRAFHGAKMDERGSREVPVKLPLRVGVRRGVGSSTFTTFFMEGERMVDHLSFDVGRTGLDVPVYRVGMAHGSDPFAQAGQPKAGFARFRAPVVVEEASVAPPVLSRHVINFHGAINRSTELEVTGLGLDAAREVLVAGIEAKILERSPAALKVLVPPSGKPTRGDIVVRTPRGESVIPNSFFAYGEAFVRCDCDGNGVPEITDMIRMLGFQFLGGPPCLCAEAADCNGDRKRDIGDPIAGLSALFLGTFRPPAPYPESGFDPDGELCGVDLPTIAQVSTREIAEGQTFAIRGEGFSRVPEENIVFAGDAQLTVVKASPKELIVETGMVITGGDARLGIIRDFLPGIFGVDPSLCRPRFCFPLFIGPAVLKADLLRLVPSQVGLIGTTKQEGRSLVLSLDPKRLDTGSPVQVQATLVTPVRPNLSPGSRKTAFEVKFSLPEMGFDEAVRELAKRLERELSGDGPLAEVLVIPDAERGTIELRPADDLLSAIDGKISVYPGTIGRCGPTNLHPINDERAFGWCRFEELVKPCNGLPQFEWFIPVQFVTSTSGSLSGVPHPNDRSPAMKSVMYNWDAYCHVRKHKLWNECALEDLIDGGATEIPDFPTSAWVLKTEWRTDDPAAPLCDRMPSGVDLTKFYKYVYSGDGRNWYLTAIHHTTKDLDKWFWMDAYVPAQILQSTCGFVRGLGGCGGTNLDMPASLTGTQWKDHFLCTNITTTQPITSGGFAGVGPGGGTSSAWCGNFQFAPECPDSIDLGGGGETCLSCHDRAEVAISGGSLKLDFLYSLNSPHPDPNPCSSGGGSVGFSTDIQPIFNASCSCHTGGGSPAGLSLAAGVSHGNLVNVNSCERPTMKRVKPNDTGMSYLWHKLNGTHNTLGSCSCPSVTGCGGQMPLGGPALSASNLTKIQQWILAGANP
ncbi:MAG: hypothetical protein HY721_02340 [Planctomycetes bacterium]|nr:hypothetical protein [Planctomycetota bacterium]